MFISMSGVSLHKMLVSCKGERVTICGKMRQDLDEVIKMDSVHER